MKNFFGRIRQLTAEAEDTSVEQLKLNTRTLSIWEGNLWALMWGLGESYIGPYALFLGAGNMVMAFLGTAPVFITSIAQLVGSGLIDRVGRRMPIILGGIAFQSAVWLPLFALPLLLPSGGVIALAACAALYFAIAGIVVPSWMSLIGDVVEPAARGQYFANRSRLVMYGMVVALLLAGIITNAWKGIGLTAVGFGLVFGIAALARTTSIAFMRRHYDAPLEPCTPNDRYSFWSFLGATENRNYARFTCAVALMSGTTNIAGPFFAVYMLRDLQWSYLLFTINTLTFMLAQTFFVRWWGSIGDRHGNRSVLLATGSLLPILPLFWVFSANYFVLLFAQVVSGAIWSGFNLAAANFIYDSVPQNRRARAVSYYSLINGLFSVIGGMGIGAWLATHTPSELHLGTVHLALSSPLPVVFVISAITRAIAAAIMLPQFREVREVEPISTARILYRLGIGQPLFGQVNVFSPRLRAIAAYNRKNSAPQPTSD
ncbi:MFS transporter [Pontiella sp.]|uniref:MFS transporter n=1 Tax=Pontiella sp. TaxID=2837462 RepID=UPI00356580F6